MLLIPNIITKLDYSIKTSSPNQVTHSKHCHQTRLFNPNNITKTMYYSFQIRLLNPNIVTNYVTHSKHCHQTRLFNQSIVTKLGYSFPTSSRNWVTQSKHRHKTRLLIPNIATKLCYSIQTSSPNFVTLSKHRPHIRFINPNWFWVRVFKTRRRQLSTALVTNLMNSSYWSKYSLLAMALTPPLFKTLSVTSNARAWLSNATLRFLNFVQLYPTHIFKAFDLLNYSLFAAVLVYRAFGTFSPAMQKIGTLLIF